MNNAEFKIYCLKNGFYSPEQVIDFYRFKYGQDSKFNKRDAQLWMNGKQDKPYLIPASAITMLDEVNRSRIHILSLEKQRLENGQKPKFVYLYKSEASLWNKHPEFINMPVNFYNSIIVELGVQPVGYYENK